MALHSSLRPAHIQAFVFRYPLATPVHTSFGTMHERPALLVRVEDADGAHGWGEAWCNFPACGAEHRARLVESVMAPLLQGRAFDSPRAAFEHLTARTAVLALQSGEPGPMAQAIAGIDLALWDLVARRQEQPLWRLLGGVHDRVGVYASGINPDAPAEMAAAQRALGHTAFKLKIGFGAARDIDNLTRLRELIGLEPALMADANQAWDLATAQDMALRIAPFGLSWLEEPLRADRPADEWAVLHAGCDVPLAAGENLIGAASFDALVAGGVVRVVQPDIAKWGGLSGCLPVIDRIRAAGLSYCPHYLGGGIGLAHSAHLLAAVGGDGLLEVDVNDNPLRTLLFPASSRIKRGTIQLGGAPGIGVEPDFSALREACGVSRTQGS